MVWKRLDAICQDVIEAVEMDTDGGSVNTRASREEKAAEPAQAGPAELPSGEGGSPNRNGLEEGDRRDLPGLGKGKPRTRSRDRWVVRPPKRTGSPKAPASVSGLDNRSQVGSPRAPIHLIHTNEAPLNSRCLRAASPTRFTTEVARKHLVLVWDAAHASAPSGART